jgi:tetratricopeptide (TPR) repeat protein
VSQDQLISVAARAHEAGRLAEAESAYRQLLNDRPGDSAMMISLADVLVDAMRFAEAEPLYRQVIAAAPDSPASAGAYDGIAAIFQDRGELEQAVPASKKAAELRGDADDAYAVGLVLENLGRGDDAVDMFQLAVKCRPGFAEAHHKLAGHLRVRGQTEDSIREYELSVAAKPEVAEFHCNLANALRLAGHEDRALLSVRRAIELKPELAEAHNVLGAIWKDRRRPSDAVGSFTRALQLKPDFAEAINNMAGVIEQAGKIDEAGALYEKAVSLRPQVPEFHENLALNQLLRGQFDRGWQESEWRRANKANPASRAFHRPVWDGNDLTGRSILLHAEQGLGDTIQFVRYAKLVRDRGAARVIVECQPALAALARGVEGVTEVIEQGQPWPEFDVHCPLMSLPIPFRTRLESIPQGVPYIHAEPEKTAAWKEKLAGLTGKRVGLIWAGNPKFRNDKIRSMPPAKLLPLAGLPGISFVSLQKGAAASAPQTLKLLDLTAQLKDFTETAALIANLDLIITVDTAVGHLAGAMGKPTWIMLSAIPDWRWMLGRDDSPWYPSVRLFRQATPGDWTGVMQRINAAISVV